MSYKGTFKLVVDCLTGINESKELHDFIHSYGEELFLNEFYLDLGINNFNHKAFRVWIESGYKSPSSVKCIEFSTDDHNCYELRYYNFNDTYEFCKICSNGARRKVSENTMLKAFDLFNSELGKKLRLIREMKEALIK